MSALPPSKRPSAVEQVSARADAGFGESAARIRWRGTHNKRAGALLLAPARGRPMPRQSMVNTKLECGYPACTKEVTFRGCCQLVPAVPVFVA